MKKVLVTGGCGFLGSHVCEVFKKNKWEVIAYDNLTKFEYSRAFKSTDQIRNYNLDYLEEIDVPTVIDDIKNVKTLDKVLGGCDLVAHCAAQPAMTIAIEDPGLDFEVNVRGTLNVLEACRRKQVPIINCSTIHMYGNEGINALLREGGTRMIMPSHEYTPAVKETDEALNGIVSPLHASKRAAEIYVLAYIDTYGLKAANFRLTGIYGPRQFGGEDHGWVANFAIKTLLGQPLKIFGTDKQVRDILYVEDAAEAFLEWYKSGCPSGTYNVGGGKVCSVSIQEVLSYLEQITGRKSTVEYLPKRHGDLWWFISDIRKARKEFKWKSKVHPREGLERLVHWIERERMLLE